jgi:NAD(P)-dependent dehydrogenase (short-subunit alcohol dehydrogenase family)/putative sterol carrier protein
MLSNTGKFAGRTVFISGASRGIGREIALKLAKDKANIIIAAKTAEPHPKLPGTIYTVAKEVEAAGGKALACLVDIRDEKQVTEAVEKAVSQFGGIDIVINNASAISLTKTTDTDMKRYDLMHQINGRGTFLVTKACIPYLKIGQNPHILNLSPPLNLNPKWFQNHVAYTMAKYNMSMCALGMSEEYRGDGIAANCIWPKTAIFTAAMEMLGGKDVRNQCRKPEIMADAAYAILSRDSHKFTGNFCIDEDVLREEGITDMNQYAYDTSVELMPDFFLDEKCEHSIHSSQYAILGQGGSDAAPAAAKSAPAADAAAKPADSAAGPPPDSDVGQVLAKVKGVVNEEAVKIANAIFQFELKGKNGGSWYLDLKNPPGTVGLGTSPKKSDVTLSMSDSDFVKMFTGKLSPTSAYMMGKLKMKGDITKAMLLDKFMGKLKSKL